MKVDESNRMSTVLVTGASGFVGGHLVKKLIDDNHYQVRVALRSPSTKAFNHHAEVFCIEDISATTTWGEALNNCEVVIHAAARVHIMQEHASDPLHEFRQVNVEGTLNLARQAAEQGVKRFIYTARGHKLRFS